MLYHLSGLAAVVIGLLLCALLLPTGFLLGVSIIVMFLFSLITGAADWILSLLGDNLAVLGTLWSSGSVPLIVLIPAFLLGVLVLFWLLRSLWHAGKHMLHPAH